MIVRKSRNWSLIEVFALGREKLGTKLGWHLIHEKDKPWAKTLLSKYTPNGGIVRFKKDFSLTSSSLWKVSPFIEKGLRWVIHNRLSTSFWDDTWSGQWPLMSLVTGPLREEESSWTFNQVRVLRDSLGEDCLSINSPWKLPINF